ncbi:PaaI family thioesterase [Thermodesulfobacteriota bacterium]
MIFEDLKPSFRSALLKKAKSKQPLWNLLGIELMDVKKGWARMRLPYSKKLIHPFGVVHGGAIFSLADAAMAMALLGLLDKDERFATIEMKMNYVKSFERGETIAEAEIINKSKRIALGETVIRDSQEGFLVAKSMATYMFLGQHK